MVGLTLKTLLASENVRSSLLGRLLMTGPCVLLGPSSIIFLLPSHRGEDGFEFALQESVGASRRCASAPLFHKLSCKFESFRLLGFMLEGLSTPGRFQGSETYGGLPRRGAILQERRKTDPVSPWPPLK